LAGKHRYRAIGPLRDRVVLSPPNDPMIRSPNF
jgi:hypothetical protein